MRGGISQRIATRFYVYCSFWQKMFVFLKADHQRFIRSGYAATIVFVVRAIRGAREHWLHLALPVVALYWFPHEGPSPLVP